MRLTAVCSATFRRDLLLQLLNHLISAVVTALQAAAQLEVARLIFCVLLDEHLSIGRSICPSIFSPRLLLLLASSAIPLLYF